jgi:hypothetical protein
VAGKFASGKLNPNRISAEDFLWAVEASCGLLGSLIGQWGRTIGGGTGVPYFPIGRAVADHASPAPALFAKLTVLIEAPRRAFFEQAYDSLKRSVYQSLYMQTEGKELLGLVQLVVDDRSYLAIAQLCMRRRAQKRWTGCRRERPVKGKIIPKLGIKYLQPADLEKI